MEYKSNTLTYNGSVVKGYLFKKIDKRGMFHTSNFHKRHFELNFQKAMIIVKKSEKDLQTHKKIPINSIRNVIMDQEDESRSTAQRDEEILKKRSKSLLSKMRKDETEMCAWNFKFELTSMYSPVVVCCSHGGCRLA